MGKPYAKRRDLLFVPDSPGGRSTYGRATFGPTVFPTKGGLYHKYCEGICCRVCFEGKACGTVAEGSKELLMEIKGIGNWTANYALMKTFRHADAFPLEDAGIHNAIKNLKKLTKKPSLEEVKKVYKKYKGWEAYATLYLWKSL